MAGNEREHVLQALVDGGCVGRVVGLSVHVNQRGVDGVRFTDSVGDIVGPGGIAVEAGRAEIAVRSGVGHREGGTNMQFNGSTIENEIVGGHPVQFVGLGELTALVCARILGGVLD
ncbi:hypothetical protein JWS13_12335 [Rhodococcus pseudokoreensis]|uniref:Uncharacterized protein n=1 Tax=Rhodococcus pseudokoreensis TaxID=2811421 RepID=A0A974WF25_9NOCA|nr:hypothetical protein [Rhodococcus pseudokoreensis]QSE95822.1 hypothetical protein JWS13_12335 [Rhodococcus pseudokoreensis]